MSTVTPIRRGCNGPCEQGRAPCSCVLSRVTLTELDLELPHCPVRTFSPAPPRTRFYGEPPRARSVVIAVIAMALLAFGLWIYPR